MTTTRQINQQEELPPAAAEELPLLPSPKGTLRGVTGAILAGGPSRRMGSNKAFLPFEGGIFIEAIHRQLTELFPEVILVTNTPELFDFLPCRKVADIYPGAGPLAGIHAALHHARNDLVFITACDMPRLNGELIRYLALRGDPEGVVVPEGAKGVEPLHAVYGKGCLSAVDEMLAQGERRVAAMYLRSRLTTVGQEELAPFDPAFTSFTNINTPEEYYSLRGTTLLEGRGERGTE